MRTPWATLSPNRYKQFGVNSGDFEVIVHYGHRRHNLVKKFLTTMPSLPFRKFDSHLKFGNSDGGDCYVVLVPNRVIEIGV
jgi:hypothetical protein